MKLYAESVSGSTNLKNTIRFGSLREHLFSQMTPSPSFHAIERMVDPVYSILSDTRNVEAKQGLLIGAIQGNVDCGILVDVPKSQSSLDNKLLRLEPYNQEIRPSVLI